MTHPATEMNILYNSVSIDSRKIGIGQIKSFIFGLKVMSFLYYCCECNRILCLIRICRKWKALQWFDTRERVSVSKRGIEKLHIDMESAPNAHKFPTPITNRAHARIQIQYECLTAIDLDLWRNVHQQFLKTKFLGSSPAAYISHSSERLKIRFQNGSIQIIHSVPWKYDIKEMLGCDQFSQSRLEN